MRVLHTGTRAAVVVNGQLSKRVNTTAGITQECPLAQLPYMALVHALLKMDGHVVEGWASASRLGHVAEVHGGQRSRNVLGCLWPSVGPHMKNGPGLDPSRIQRGVIPPSGKRPQTMRILVNMKPLRLVFTSGTGNSRIVNMYGKAAPGFGLDQAQKPCILLIVRSPLAQRNA